VSGAIHTERAADRETPIGWVLERLQAHDAVSAAGDAPVEIERGDARFVLTVARHDGEVLDAAVDVGMDDEDERQLALFDEIPTGGEARGLELPELTAIPAAPLHDVRRLSYSALALFERCSYRFYAERVLGLPRREVTRAAPEGGSGGLAATEIGDAVHRLLEVVPLAAPATPERTELAATVRGWYPSATDDELDRIAGLVDAYCASPTASRLAALPDARAERPFTFEHDGVLIRGRLDVHWQSGERALVVDYKSNVLEGREPADIVEDEYTLQRLVYALVCFRAGASEVEIAYQFLERPNDVVSATFTADDTPALEADLSAAIARIRAGEFRPTPSEFACSDCPALDVVCAGPRLALSR
jgi:hypothetical protein